MLLDQKSGNVKKYFKNAYDVKICDDGSLWPVRFSDKLFSEFHKEESRRVRSYCPSGVGIELVTDSSYIKLHVQALAFARNFAYFDLYIDDVFIETVGAEPVKSLPDSVSFDLCRRHLNGKIKDDKKMQKVTIYLPHLADVRIKAIEPEAGSIVEHCSDEAMHKKTMLCLGDSITQGMTAKNPSSAYPVQLARFLGINMLNHGIGGDIFDEKILDEDMDIKPDIITVAYGINDWYRFDSVDYFKKMCKSFFNKLTTLYPEAKIYAITPVWCSSEGEPKAMGYLYETRKEIEQIAGRFKSVHIINGLKMVPNMPEYFVDGVHPNDLGFMHYGLNLLKEIQKRE
jgi:lysophospholipase L1-like esterase